jgi:2-succinyl-6-hydroxy-2,4-cyclohexadiene-1-carboxylate synthase
VTTLHAERQSSGPTLVLAHGFTQTGRLWGPFGEALATGRQLVAVDLPGHGGSSEVHADLTEGGRLLLEAGTASRDPSADADPGVDLLGYSLGARFALHAALDDPRAVRRLILIGGTAGIDDEGRRHERRARDDALAAELEASGDLAAFLRRWLAAPMFAGLDPAAAGVEERARNTPAGLASSLRLAGTGTQRPRWDELDRLEMPTLLVAGADDPRFVAAAVRMAERLPHGVVALVPGARHAAHLHQPALTARIVGHWLDTTA